MTEVKLIEKTDNGKVELINGKYYRVCCRGYWTVFAAGEVKALELLNHMPDYYKIQGWEAAK